MLTYIKLAKPDLLTYDWYYFHTWDKDNYIGAKDMAGHLAEYRDLALGGWEGNKKDYMAFGQYSQGYVNEGTYKLTGSAFCKGMVMADKRHRPTGHCCWNRGCPGIRPNTWIG